VPIPDLGVHVLDRRGRPVPAAVPGELHVGGAGVCRGYLERPGLTAERFVPDPFAGAAGARLYRSGDLARFRPPGELEYLGRIDHQIKIRGFRIEPAEIEAALAAHPRVRQAAVVARDDLPSGRGLVAYYVAAGEADDDLRTWLRARLPEHMVPSWLVPVPSLPATATGKLDRRALALGPPPDGARPDLAPAYVPPCTALEQVLAAAWSEALGVDRVGRHDSFFDLGGHSLLATQVVSWVRETFEVELPLADLFAAPTVAGLAAALLAEADEPDQVERTAELVLELGEIDDAEVLARLAEPADALGPRS
jgi:acyl carrier protein